MTDPDIRYVPLPDIASREELGRRYLSLISGAVGAMYRAGLPLAEEVEPGLRAAQQFTIYRDKSSAFLWPLCANEKNSAYTVNFIGGVGANLTTTEGQQEAARVLVLRCRGNPTALLGLLTNLRLAAEWAATHQRERLDHAARVLTERADAERALTQSIIGEHGEAVRALEAELGMARLGGQG